MEKFVKAVKKGDLQKIGELLQSPDFNVNELDPKSGKSVIQLAMQNGENQAVKMLISKEELNINLASKNGELLLQTAILVNSVEYVEAILRKKPNPKKKNGKGQSIMQIAIKNRINPEILKRLILNNFDINQVVAEQGSLCNLAIQSDQYDNFLQLLSHPGVNLTKCDDQQNTPLLLATKLKKADFIKAILDKIQNKYFTQIERQFFINHQDQDGNSALHIAAIKDYQTIMDLLLRQGKPLGLDQELVNKQGKNYTYYLQQRKQESLMMISQEKRKNEEKTLKAQEKKEQRKRKLEEELMQRAAKKKEEKEAKVKLQMEIQHQKQVSRNKKIWITGIVIVAIIGGMYLVLLNSMPHKKV